ncbi:flagellar chaperone protein [Citrobacter rodentium]|uniref:Lateral flagellar chaperone protein n=2 Tax=Citrobacter rodentium TaxID=67825 RepID=D2TJ98_CITRI|nr:flagellar chaperone protein [Citrobacter rodentium]KIQ51181.1 flagellar protein FliT [Citrobacter rodentium]QBY31557.1 flagellar protein FliT [Citrobacter rodentium]UHO31086.1 flagellar protein FliT [Citrobacter rodentium NBRC 105723 = DSM 16636]CBG87106.1 lateral flagellar chaperone protein [Citrobacter rodentium ICC168]HAT8014138.1 flagellar protein FliT [Citrobacter rodentium NBRC 105723 = DSM 16636]
MDRESQQRQLFALIDAMNEALDKQRWRRLPALRQQLMRQFAQYQAQESSETELRAVKERLRAAFADLIERRSERAALLKARMDKHQQLQEGVLAYSMMTLISEKA